MVHPQKITRIHMVDRQSALFAIYAAFNSRNVPGALSLMSPTVSWPKASEGGRVEGKEDIEAYWRRQWESFDPHVEPVEIFADPDGRTRVRVHQLVRDLQGNLLSDTEVWHIYTFSQDLIERMDLGEESSHTPEAPSSAFRQH